MVREHQQYWQAAVWYEDALQSYGLGPQDSSCCKDNLSGGSA